ncbi:MAG: FHA domain-containing protein, partial [Bdellovibrionales bacterium]|nr:FHA domain-containing protein [Bdellovibrionales bacterium]
ATLDTSAASEGSAPADPNKGRVRQRTMSKPSDVLNSVADEFAQDLKGNESEDFGGLTGNEPQSEAVLDDPLGAFVEEVEVEEAKVNGGVATDQSSSDTNIGKSVTAAEPSSVIAKPEPAQEAARGSSGLNFSRSGARSESPSKEVVSEQASNIPSGSFERKRAKSSLDVRSVDNQSMEQASKSDSEGKSLKRDAPRVQDSVPEARHSDVRIDRSKETSEPSSRVSVEQNKQPGGRLFGWLVSYADSQGVGIELREGQFFVTQSSLKPTDLVLDDSSISTPHAIVRVSLEKGLEIQDLMSDAGVSIRKRGTRDFERQEDRVQIEHGDWIRFGEVEFLVSLIAHVGDIG